MTWHFPAWWTRVSNPHRVSIEALGRRCSSNPGLCNVYREESQMIDVNKFAVNPGHYGMFSWPISPVEHYDRHPAGWKMELGCSLWRLRNLAEPLTNFRFTGSPWEKKAGQHSLSLSITEYLSCEVLLSRLWNGILYLNMKADDSTVVGQSWKHWILLKVK